jgi:hypothetical protein
VKTLRASPPSPAAASRFRSVQEDRGRHDFIAFVGPAV